MCRALLFYYAKSTPLPTAATAPWWRKSFTLLGNLLLFLLITSVVVAILDLPIGRLLPEGFLSNDPRKVAPLYYDWGILLVAVLSGLFAMNAVSVQLPIKDYGFASRKSWSSFRIGVAGATILLLLVFVFLWLGDWLQITAVNWQTGPLLGWLVFFLIQPLTEEIVMRSVLQNQVHRFFGRQAGLVVTAITFGALHMGNDHFSWIAALEIVAGGYIMGLLFLRYDNIWAPWAFHAAWNFVQSIVLGFAVSGMDTYRLLHIELSGPSWLTGGDFGIEGSIPGLIVTLAAIVYFWRRPTDSLNGT